MRWFSFAAVLMLIAGSLSCGVKHTVQSSTDRIIDGRRIITFSGYEWVVESSGDRRIGPGNNLFSASTENVWLDKDGRLHLRITNRGGIWYCSKLTMLHSYGYGKYIFQVDSRVDNFDKNVVGGLFTYRNDTEEIDIEFSRWSIDGNMDSQFAIQPSSKAENKRRYFLNYSLPQSTHWFNWQPEHIDFLSYRGHATGTPEEKDIIQKWSYTGPDNPPDLDERAKINLWLFRGNPPSNDKETEMIISKFSIQ